MDNIKGQRRNDDEKGHKYVSDVRTYAEDLLKIMLRSVAQNVSDMNLDSLSKELKRLKESSVAPFNRPPFEKLIDTLANGGGGKPIKIINDAHHKFDGTIGVAQATEVKAFWEKTLQGQLFTAFMIYREYEAYTGEPRIFPWMENILELPSGTKEKIAKLSLMNTGIAAAAKTDGRAGDGQITIHELEVCDAVNLHNHEVYQLSAGTLDPVANIGDLVIVSRYAKVHERNLIVTAFGSQLLARRYNRADIHPNIAILTGQATDPHSLPQPVIAPDEKIKPRKIVGTIFASHLLPPPPFNEDEEIIQIQDFAVVEGILKDATLYKVDGRSAEPIALDTQYLITRKTPFDPSNVLKLEGRLVIAVDDSGTRYFKRFRRHGPAAVLESLNSDGTTSSEILSLAPDLPFPKLEQIFEVVGVLFELPEAG